MKKILLATSAMVLAAGAASAEVALSGSARMGLVHDGSLDAGSGETYFSSRVRIVFTASGETDTGLSFGASMRADQQGGNNNDGGVGVDKDGDSNGDSTVFISGAFGKLTMGDVSGAADALVGQVSGVGYGPNDERQEIGFIGTDKTAVYYEYSAGALTFGLGAGQIYQPDPGPAGADTNDALNIGAKYATDAYSVALAYETNDVADMISLGASATFGAATVKARVSDIDVATADTVWALSLDYAMGATTLTGFYTDFGNTSVSNITVVDGDDTQHYGIGVAYDLGGGATVAGGIVRQNNDVAPDATFADVGLKFSF